MKMYQIILPVRSVVVSADDIEQARDLACDEIDNIEWDSREFTITELSANDCPHCYVAQREGYARCPVHYNAEEDNQRSIEQTGLPVTAL